VTGRPPALQQRKRRTYELKPAGFGAPDCKLSRLGRPGFTAAVISMQLQNSGRHAKLALRLPELVSAGRVWDCVNGVRLLDGARKIPGG